MLLDFNRFCWLPLVMLATVSAAQDRALTIRSGEHTVILAPAELAGMPVSKLTIDEGEKHEFEGVALVELLKRAGVTFGQTLRGPRLATYLVATGADGYRVVIALPEIDPEFCRHPGALVALEQDGQRLSARDGPLQLVLPGDKRHARWVRGLISLEVLTAPGAK